MKKCISLLLAVIVTVLFSSCAGRGTVVKKINNGNEYMTIEGAEQYILGLLGENAYLYEVEVYEKDVRFTLKEETKETDWLSRTISFDDGTDITLSCTYPELRAQGWKSETNINNKWGSGENIFCNNQGQRIF